VQQLVAQKHIDNVLDIKDDEIPEGNAEEPRMVKSKTMPSMKEEKEDNVWGSFNGSLTPSRLFLLQILRRERVKLVQVFA
jgi:hypothetical protein